MPARLTLILGGARSGKSAYAEKLAAGHAQPVLYVATAEARDAEMKARIATHRQQRPANWTTLEAPRKTGQAIARHAPFTVVLIDCITLLASNAIVDLPENAAASIAEAAVHEEIDALLAARASSTGNWYLISNEVGLGLVPPYPMGRLYRDALGRANQKLACEADEVLFMVAGLPMKLK
jgi:adenosylcobinamide kinase/adenosylcobinamide-phosphate guanylyltransferase